MLHFDQQIQEFCTFINYFRQPIPFARKIEKLRNCSGFMSEIMCAVSVLKANFYHFKANARPRDL